MNRRAFLASLLATATIDPERLLWRPGAKLISIPKGWDVYEFAGQRFFRVFDEQGHITTDVAWYKVWDDGRVDCNNIINGGFRRITTKHDLDALSVPMASFSSIRHMERGF